MSEFAARGLHTDERVKLGATLTSDGCWFAIQSRNATTVELCLFDDVQQNPSRKIALKRGHDGVFSVFIQGISAGQRYGYHVHGPNDPARGHRFNSALLLVDPYADAVTHEPRWTDLSVAGAPKSIVIDHSFDWGDDRRPRTSWAESTIYECHVRGMTMRHPLIQAEHKGTYAALSDPSLISHFKSLGVTALELLPIHEMADEPTLQARDARNYWGYSTVGFFAPSGRYASGERRYGSQVQECKAMVRALHKAGIEVILDVVYNHTVEGNQKGPTICLKGVDNAGFYRLNPTDLSLYEDVTGTGNSLDLSKPAALRLVLDSLHHWVREYHVDGFRFDLAPALARGRSGEFEVSANFLSAIINDPILSQCKLIAEPWDVGRNGYQLGAFPQPIREWNGAYRDALRRYWLSRAKGARASLASRFTGSSDVFSAQLKAPTASINFITCHDGFTLHDLLSYQQKHNEANGENNRDGSDHEQSDSHGFEGITDDVAINDARLKSARNLLTSLLLSMGVPMLSHGDEFLRTQHGNNNAYCQDGPLSYVDWAMAHQHAGLSQFVTGLQQLRKQLWWPRSTAYLHGLDSNLPPDALWFDHRGHALTAQLWNDSATLTLALLFMDPHTHHASALLLMNPEDQPQTFVLPREALTTDWQIAVNTVSGEIPYEASVQRLQKIDLAPRSMMVLKTL